jgi:hypothetical protein
LYSFSLFCYFVILNVQYALRDEAQKRFFATSVMYRMMSQTEERKLASTMTQIKAYRRQRIDGKTKVCQSMCKFVLRRTFVAMSLAFVLWDQKRGLRKLVMLCEHKTALSTIRRVMEMTENDDLSTVLARPELILKGLSIEPDANDYRKLSSSPAGRRPSAAPVASRVAEDLQRRLHGVHSTSY